MQTSVTLSAPAFPGLHMVIQGGRFSFLLRVVGIFLGVVQNIRRFFVFPVFWVACVFETRVAVFGRLNLTLMRLVWSKSLGHFIFEVDNAEDKMVSLLGEILQR